LSALMKKRTRADWLSALEAARCQWPINDLADVFKVPQVWAREMTVPDPASLTDS